MIRPEDCDNHNKVLREQFKDREGTIDQALKIGWKPGQSLDVDLPQDTATPVVQRLATGYRAIGWNVKVDRQLNKVVLTFSRKGDTDVNATGTAKAK